MNLKSSLFNEVQSLDFLMGGRRTALIYRSQVTKDEDWFDMLNSLADRQSFDYLVALGDDFERKIHKK